MCFRKAYVHDGVSSIAARAAMEVAGANRSGTGSRAPLELAVVEELEVAQPDHIIKYLWVQIPRG